MYGREPHVPFSEKEVNDNELESIIKHINFDRTRVYFNKETIELAGKWGI